MSPANKPDPYRLDSTAPAPVGSPAAPQKTDLGFDVLEKRGIHVVTLLRGQLVEAHEIDALGADIKNYFATKPAAKVVLDMQNVHFLSSSALGMLITLKSSIGANGGAFVLAGLRDDLQKIFKITKLDKILKIKENVNAATASM